MRLNGSLYIARGKGMAYHATFTPLGHDRAQRPTRVFPDRRALEQFMAGPMAISNREINAACNALFCHGSYALYEVWLTEEQMREQGLGQVWTGAAVYGGLAYHSATAA